MASRSCSGRDPRLAQAGDGHAAGHRAAAPDAWSGLRFGYNLLWLASFAFGSLGALLLFAWPPLLKTDPERPFLTIVVGVPLGGAGPVPAVAAESAPARLPRRRRLGAALEPLERRAAELVLRRMGGAAGAARPGCRPARPAADRLCARPYPVRARDGGPLAAPGAGRSRPAAARAGGERDDRRVAAVRLALAALGVQPDEDLLARARGGGPTRGRQRGRPFRRPYPDAAGHARRPKARPVCSPPRWSAARAHC